MFQSQSKNIPQIKKLIIEINYLIFSQPLFVNPFQEDYVELDLIENVPLVTSYMSNLSRAINFQIKENSIQIYKKYKSYLEADVSLMMLQKKAEIERLSCSFLKQENAKIILMLTVSQYIRSRFVPPERKEQRPVPQQILHIIRNELIKQSMGLTFSERLLACSLRRFSYFSMFSIRDLQELVKDGVEYSFYPKNSIIIEQQAISEHFYVLLKGEVTSQGQNEKQYIEVGQAFGEIIPQKFHSSQSKLSSKNAYRSHEDCEIIKIKYECFKNIMLKPVMREFMHRIIILKEALYLQDIDPYASVILSLLGEVRNYGYGEVVLFQKTLPDSFCVVLEGSCKCVFDKVLTTIKE